MNNKHENVFDIYKSGAKKAITHIKNFPKEKLYSLFKKYPQYLQNYEDIKITNMLNCMALDHDKKSWAEYKKYITEDLLITEHKYKLWQYQLDKMPKNQIPFTELMNLYQRPLTYSDIHELNSPDRQPIENVNFSNLNFSLANYMNYDDLPFHGVLGWCKIINSNFSNCNFLSFLFTVSHLENVSLKGCSFSVLPLKIEDGDIEYRYPKRTRSNFEGAKLINCDLSDSILFDTYGRGAVFNRCNFSNAILYNSNFFDADFSNCNFENANLMNMTLGKKLKGANFSGAIMLGGSAGNFIGTIINDKTIFYDGTKIDPHKNNLELISRGIYTDQDEIIWWHCQNGHEWQQELRNFSKSPGCSYCLTHYSERRNKNIKFFINNKPDLMLFRISNFLPIFKSVCWNI